MRRRPAPAAIELPAYRRRALTAGIVHLGVGAFHRAHQATYLHDLAQRGHREWGVVGVSLRSPRPPHEHADPRHAVVTRGSAADRLTVVDVTRELLHAPSDPEAVLRALADPAVRLVTLTVTADGYPVDPATRLFDGTDPDVLHDLADPARPRSMAGFLVEALRRRRATGAGPLTVLSCDNVLRNGEVTRAAVVGLAGRRDAALATWIDRSVGFPSSMVDRISTRPDGATAVRAAAATGLPRLPVVVAEPFRQWVVEDRFTTARPPLEEVGAQVVADVGPHELTKRRMLNGSHCALAWLGLLAGHRTAAEAAADPLLRAYLDRLMAEEVAPMLPAVASIDLDGARRAVLARLANPRLHDELERLGRRGSRKVGELLAPALLEARAAGRPTRLLELAIAAWVRAQRGVDERGRRFEVRDQHAAELRALEGPDPRGALGHHAVAGDLAGDEELVDAVREALERLRHGGVRAAIADALMPDPDLDLESVA